MNVMKVTDKETETIQRKILEPKSTITEWKISLEGLKIRAQQAEEPVNLKAAHLKSESEEQKE